jgi:hypothetical protein
VTWYHDNAMTISARCAVALPASLKGHARHCSLSLSPGGVGGYATKCRPKCSHFHCHRLRERNGRMARSDRVEGPPEGARSLRSA